MRITLAFPYVTAGGRHFRAGTTITVERPEANRLIHAGLARRAVEQEGPEVEEPTEAQESTTTAAEPPAEEG